MRETVFKKALSLLLCAVLILGVLPLDSHAAGYQVNGQSITWYFPLPEEFFDDIEDFAGCRGANENSLYGTPNLGCTHADHAELPYGSEAMIVNVSDTQPVYAPADGTLYRSSQPDSQWGDVAVIEATVDSNFSIYILMGSVSPDGVTASGSYVPSGSVIGYTSGIFRLGALMDFAGMGAQVAENLAGELSVVQSKGWLSEGVNTGLVCVNPSASTATGYPNSLVYDHSGPILYEFVPGQPVTEPSTEPPTEAPTEAPHTEHSWDGGTVTIPATHTSEGSIHYTCTICGAGRDEAIPADVNAHVFDQQVVSEAYLAAPANCASGAQYYYSCVCGAAGTETFVSGDATGEHVWDGGTVTVPATHTTQGNTHYTCTICGASYDEPIAADVNAHVFDQQVASDTYLAAPANCASGARYYYSCVCGAAGTETFVSGDATGEHVWDGGVVTVPATHTTQGNTHYTCTICGASYDDPIAADVNAHVFDQQVASDAYLVAPANCAGGAQYRYSCVCGAAGEATFVSGDATGAHVWDDGTVTVPATHTSEGSIHYTCTICGAGRDEAIPADVNAHVFDQEVVDDKYLASPATCSNAATYFKSCICGEKGSETFLYGNPAPHTYSDQWSFNETDHWRAATCGHNGETTDFGPHKWDDGKIIKDAGHNVNGEKLYTCTTCGTTKTETIAGQPHEYNQMVISDQYLASPATCTSPATYYFACVCGEKGSEVFSYGEAKGHTYSDRWSSNELQHWHAATCEHTGEKADAADHVWNPGQITTQPTATSKGVMTYTCSICGATKTEDVEPTQHEHTFAATWAGNTTYHWHPATCEHTNVVSGLGEHIWNQGVVTSVASHSAAGQKQYTCTVCGIQKTETVPQTHTYDQQIASSAYLASNATCTSPATYYYSCSCGAKDTTRTFTSGSALGHVASGTWGKDANYHWYVCSRCGARGELNAHTLNTSGTCTVCGYSKEESHIHSSHLSRVPAKAATCTQEGNSAYYICDCGKWFSDVTTTSEITDQKSVVIPALGHVDKDNNGRCDLCKERLDNTVEYQITEGKDSTWLNTSSQGLVIRSNAAYSQFDRVEVDGATVAVTNYSVSEGSTIVELNASYLRRLSLGYHTISIVAKDGKATTGFTIKQGAATSGGSSNGIWGMILFLAVVIAIAIPVTYGVYYYRKKTGNGRYS